MLADGGEQAAGTALPEGADLGEVGGPQGGDVRGELGALRAVVVNVAPLALGIGLGEGGVGGDGLPPLGPVLGVCGMAAGEAAVVLALLDLPVQAGQDRGLGLVDPQVVAVEEDPAGPQQPGQVCVSASGSGPGPESVREGASQGSVIAPSIEPVGNTCQRSPNAAFIVLFVCERSQTCPALADGAPMHSRWSRSGS